MTDEEIQHLRRLRKTIKQRLDELEVQAATFGPARVPAEISVEMRGAREEIERIDATLKLPTISTAVQEATGPEAAINVLRNRVEHLGDQTRDAMLWMNTQILEMRNESRDWRQAQEAKHEAGARLYRVILTWLTVGLIGALMLIVFILAKLS